MNPYPKLNLNTIEVPKLEFSENPESSHRYHRSVDSSSLGSDSTWHIPITEHSDNLNDPDAYFDYHEEELLSQEAGNYHIIHRPKQDGKTIKVVRRRKYLPLSAKDLQRIGLDSLFKIKDSAGPILPIIDANKTDQPSNQKIQVPAENSKEQTGLNSPGRVNPLTVPTQLNLKRATSERVLHDSRAVSPFTLKRSKHSHSSLHKLNEEKSLNFKRIIYSDYTKLFHWKTKNIKPRTFQELGALLNKVKIAHNPKLRQNSNLASRSRQRFKTPQMIEQNAIRQEYPSYSPLIKKCEAVKHSISPLINIRNNPMFKLTRTSKLLKDLVSYPDVSRSNPSNDQNAKFLSRRFKWNRNASKLMECDI